MSYQAFVFATDPHATNKWAPSRTDNFLQTILGKLKWVVSFANDNNAHLILGGDTVDRFNTAPEVVNSIIRILRKADKQVYGIIGNHDIYGHNYEVINNVILGGLFASGIVELLNSDPIFITDEGITTQLTGVNYIPNIDSNRGIYTVKRDPRADKAIHVVHSFLVTKHWPSLERTSYSVVTEVQTNADVICTGHEHQGYGIRVFEDTLFTNPGSLGRISSSLKEISRQPKVTLIHVYKDHVEAELVDVPAKPGNEVLSRKQLEAEKAHKLMLTEFKSGLEERQLCDLDEIFKEQSKVLGVSEDIQEVGWKAIREFERRSVGGKP